MTSSRILVAYGLLSAGLGVAAHMASTLFEWPLPGVVAFIASSGHIVALYETKDRLWEEPPPIIRPTRRVALLVRLALVVLVVHAVALARQFDRDPSQANGERILIAAFTLMGGTIGAIAAVGLDAALGRLLATAIRTPFHLAFRLFDGVASAVEAPFRARRRARHRAKRREERRRAAGLRDDGQSRS